MAFASWFRRSLSKSDEKIQKADLPEQSNQEEDELLGVTDQLVDFIKSFTLDTFKSFPLQEDEGGNNGGDDSPTTSANIRKDLSQWQERHATLVLSKVKEISQLRYMLCPRHLKERQFWRIYFRLVKSYVAEYEQQAIRVAKLKRMAMENEKSLDTSTYEVEMAEAKQATSAASLTPMEHDLDSLDSGSRNGGAEFDE
ncbi:hypothetical protein L1049_004323 [Liquidambar formosana]|uniref:BSD domain-containing protein n=1 Tax=Liquidambar formosana TaxID=63359 RepID=A0AAP0RNA5_LIQFO